MNLQPQYGECACAYCGGPAAMGGPDCYSVHRDEFDRGPEVYLCKQCVMGDRPTLNEIWRKIGNPDPLIWEMKLITGEATIVRPKDFGRRPKTIPIPYPAKDKDWKELAPTLIHEP